MATASPLDRERPATLQTSWSSRVVGSLEEWTPLESASTLVAGWLDSVMRFPGATRVKDVLHGRWLGHALHPVMVDLPIGFWTSAMFLDAIGHRRSARLLTLAGTLSAVGAVATGAADWSVTDGRERRLGLVHGVLNATATVLNAASLIAPKRYRGLSWTGGALATASAYLGGELVFGRGLMVDHDTWLAGPEKWTAVSKVDAIPDGRTKGVKLEGRTLLLYRSGADVYAMEATCSHAGGPLQDGEVNDGIVTCPWHGSKFRLTDGACLLGPATFPQLRLQSRIRDGQFEVRGRKG
jgi:nitrite reductase/ring-hydroxylating ferredoxin subunit/uncharacterized membrane protein